MLLEALKERTLSTGTRSQARTHLAGRCDKAKAALDQTLERALKRETPKKRSAGHWGDGRPALPLPESTRSAYHLMQ